MKNLTGSSSDTPNRRTGVSSTGERDEETVPKPDPRFGCSHAPLSQLASAAPDPRQLTLRQADQALCDLYAIQDDLDFIKVELAHLQTRRKVWRAAMPGMLGGARCGRHVDRGVLAIVSMSLRNSGLPALAWCVFLMISTSLASASEHRSRAVAREFEREQPCPSTGKTSGPCPGYRKDHIVPLACGGPDTVSNLQWQTIREARAKDHWERRGCTH